MYYHNEYCFTQFYSTSLQERHTIVLLLHVKMFLTIVQLLDSLDFMVRQGVTVLWFPIQHEIKNMVGEFLLYCLKSQPPWKKREVH